MLALTRGEESRDSRNGKRGRKEGYRGERNKERVCGKRKGELDGEGLSTWLPVIFTMQRHV